MKKTLTDYIKEIINRSSKEQKKDLDKRLKWRPVKTLSRRLNLSTEETLIFSYAYFATITKKVFHANEIREEISEDPFDISNVLNILKKLNDKKLITSNSFAVDAKYKVQMEIIMEISQNKIPEITDPNKKKDFFSLCENLLELFFLRIDGIIGTDEFYGELDKFLSNNKKFKPFKYLMKNQVPQEEWLIFLYTFLAHINGEKDANLKKGIKKCYGGVKQQFNIRTKLDTKKAKLIEKGIIVFHGDDFQSAERVSVSDEALKAILKADYNAVASQIKTEETSNDLINPHSIQVKTLFHNKKEKEMLSTIKRIVDKDRLVKIQEQLSKSGHRTGVCILLHGKPGTGKTETVLQISKDSGRPVMKVDIASVRDKFIGESEKNLANIFRKYERLREASDITPILLFNEADALLNKRISVNSSTDQMNNSMQNILLDELDNFKGILFATTNLTPNMDKAFERRFLYKLKLSSPRLEVRQLIWKNELPGVDEDIISFIAEKYNLSGGQIENVVRKIKLDEILHEKVIDRPTLNKLCKQEYLNTPSREKRAIGFKSNKTDNG